MEDEMKDCQSDSCKEECTGECTGDCSMGDCGCCMEDDGDDTTEKTA